MYFTLYIIYRFLSLVLFQSLGFLNRYFKFLLFYDFFIGYHYYLAMTSSQPTSVPGSPDRKHLPGCEHIILPKYIASEHIWRKWCNCFPCRNILFEDQVMVSDDYESFCSMIGKKYHANLHSDVPLITHDWTPKRYISKIRSWCYERYAKHFGLPWGKGQDAQLP